MKYEYGRIDRLAQALENYDVAEEIKAQILTDGDTIRTSTKPEKKAAWMKAAMDKMDELIDEDTRKAVRESCACCLGGKRLKLSKEIAKNHQCLEDRIKAANDTKYVFGNRVEQREDGSILVSFYPEGREDYRCVCMPKATEPISITYCYCCGGHVKHHLETALGLKLKCKVASSPLSSGGKEPCTFIFEKESL